MKREFQPRSDMRRILLCTLVPAITLGVVNVAEAGPPPMDPKQMSGLARLDPAVPAGTITVRVLEGGFESPAVGTEVKLEIVSADGQRKDSRTAVTQAPDGRAVFDNLGEFTGGQAIATAAFDGKPVVSQAIPIAAEQGSRVMLVKGAAAPSASPEIPALGAPFVLPDRPAGELTVGTYDLGARKPLPGVEVTLTVTPPEGEPTQRKEKSDAQGRVIFAGLETLPKGAKLTVEGVLVPGQEPKRSEEFQLDAEKGMAVVLAEGKIAPRGSATQQGPRRLPGPRILPSIPVGTVRVRVVDPNDRPLADQPVSIIKRAAGGSTETFKGQTSPDGVAVISNVSVKGDSIYFAEVQSGGAPWRSSMFGLDSRGGVLVEQRVWKTTSDRSRVKSAIDFDVEPVENDMAQIIQIYDVIVDGEEAFWDPSLKIEGIEGAKGMVVLREAESWLAHEEKAPFATLAGPIPPGAPAHLYLGYLVEHDGSVEVQWAPPFNAIGARVLVSEELDLEADGASLSKERPEAVVRGRKKAVYELPPPAPGEAIEFIMEDLPVRSPIYRWVAAGGLVAMLVAMFGGIIFRSRRSTYDLLQARKEELISMLARQSENGDGEGPERQRLLTALDQTDRQLRALEQLRSPAQDGA